MTRLSLLLTVSLGILTLSLFRFSLDSSSPFLRRRNHHRKQEREIRQGTTFSSCWSMHHVSMLRFSRPVACWRSGRYHWPIGQQPSHGVTSPAPRRGSRNRPRSTALSRQRPLTSPAALPRRLLAPSHRPAIYYSTRHIYQHHQHSATPVHSIIRLSLTSRLSLRPPLRPSHPIARSTNISLTKLVTRPANIRTTFSVISHSNTLIAPHHIRLATAHQPPG
jgi:hypothetical protein